MKAAKPNYLRRTLPERESRVTVPKRCHPIAKVVFAEMARQRVTYDELETLSGVLVSTFKAWRTDNRPGLDTAEAALGALGWTLLPVPSPTLLDDEVRDRLNAIAAEFGLDEGDVLSSYIREVATTERKPLHQQRSRADLAEAA